MELSEVEQRVIQWMRSVSQTGRKKIEFWAEAVFETELWMKNNVNRRETWRS